MSSDASSPFNEPSADIIICSSDNVLFRLHRVILSLASDFFKDMLCLPQPDQQPITNLEDSCIDGLSVVHVSEPGNVLDRLFRLCYPVDDPALGTTDELRSTLEAALKYQMAEAVKITKKHLRSLVHRAPLSAYAIACHFELEAEAKVAAVEVLEQMAQNKYFPELEDIPIGAYHRLLSYCERNGRVSDRFRFTFHTSGGGRERPTPASTPSLAKAVLKPIVPMHPVIPDVLPEPEVPPYPFNAMEAEVTLVASDGMEFRVFASILQIASPVLFSKVSELQPSASKRIPVSEPSRILSILLQICYPVPDPHLFDLYDISAALISAEKYKMQHACQSLRAALTAKGDGTSEDPVILYAVACRFCMRGLALAAARRTLRTDIMKSPVAELDSIGVSGGCLYRLISYRERCRAAILAMFLDYGYHAHWIDPEMLVQLQGFCSLGRTLNPCWYEPYMNQISLEQWPSANAVMNEDFLQGILESTCTRDSNGYPCSCFTAHGAFLFMKFSKHVAEALHAEENRQPLSWVSTAPDADAA